MARPRKQIDPEKVEKLAMVGCPPNEIAAELGCEHKTIDRRFGGVVKKGAERGKLRIRSKLFKMAIEEDNLGAAIFLAKAWCGMREREDGVTVNVSQTAVTLNPAQVKANLAELQKIVLAEAKRLNFVNGNGNGNGEH